MPANGHHGELEHLARSGYALMCDPRCLCGRELAYRFDRDASDAGSRGQLNTPAQAQSPGPSEEILNRVRCEYLEMPGLSLTLRQAQRLWGLSQEECEAVLEQLLRRQFLCCTPRGAFVKA